MNLRSFAGGLCHLPLSRRAAMVPVALALFSLASCADPSAIRDAARRGDVEKVKTLVQDHPKLVFSQDNHGRTPLHWAAMYGRKEVAEVLLANKAEVNANDELGWTPLRWAAMFGQKDVAELLRKHGGQNTTIHESAQRGDVEKVGAPLKGNPDLVFSKDDEGRTPLHRAAMFGRKDVAALLLAKGADVNARNNFGDTPLDAAAFNGTKEVAELLLANGADVNAKDNNGWTPLHWAVLWDQKEMAGFLLARKADVNARDNEGMTPLQRAAYFGHKDVAILLLANKADVNSKANNGSTPLRSAVEKGHKDVAELLREHGGQE